MEDMRATAGVISVVALLAVFFGVWNTVSMTVRDRAQEFGVLRTLGFSRSRIAALVVMEGSAIALIGGALAVPAILAGLELFRRVHGDITFMGVNVPVQADAGLLALSLPVAMAAGALSALLPALAAASKPVVEALRSVD
jgi:putative ABC transport system permease protein